MVSKSVLLVNDRADMGKSYYVPFAFIGPKVDNPSVLQNDPNSVALVVFTGGADVNPTLYNESVGKQTHIDKKRDKQEIDIFNQALSLNIPMFGICRGVQFLTVQFGGKLVQHVTNHHQSHAIQTADGIEFNVTSSHHQMCLPAKEDNVLAWSSRRLSDIYLNGHNQIMSPPFREVEAVQFRENKAVGVQFHPEIMPPNTHGFFYVQDLIQRYFPHILQA